MICFLYFAGVSDDTRMILKRYFMLVKQKNDKLININI